MNDEMDQPKKRGRKPGSTISSKTPAEQISDLSYKMALVAINGGISEETTIKEISEAFAKQRNLKAEEKIRLEISKLMAQGENLEEVLAKLKS